MSRYTTSKFGEVVYLLGEFTAGRALGEISLTLIDLPTNAVVPLDDADCFEVVGSTFGGFSTYAWASSNITTPAVDPTQYLYVMEDTVPTVGKVQKGKWTVGGYPDESARRQYQDTVHIDASGTPLATLATTTVSVTFASSGTDSMTQAGVWSAEYAVGRRVQISGTALNDGVTSPIVSITGGGTVLNFALGGGLDDGAFTPESISTTAVVKSNVYGAGQGTDRNPVDNVRDARQIADDLGFGEYHIHGGSALDIDFGHDFWGFNGRDQDLDLVNFVAGSSNESARFNGLSITGALNGRIACEDCILGSTTITGVTGTFINCAFKGTIVLGGNVIGDKCASRSSVSTIIDNSGSYSFLLGSVQGVFTIISMTGGMIGMNLAGTILQIHATCTGGTITAIGSGEFLYTPGSGPTFADYVARGSHLIATTDAGAARGVINIGNGTTDQWKEERYAFNRQSLASDTVITHRYSLYDQDGVAIAGNHLAGNNPLFDPTRLIAERRRTL